MHEVSLVSSLIDQIEDEARRQNFKKVINIRLEIGEFSGVNADSIEFCYSELTKNTVLEDSHLVIQHQSVVLLCSRCQQNTRCESVSESIDDFICSHCGSRDIRILRGKEFRVIDLDVI